MDKSNYTDINIMENFIAIDPICLGLIHTETATDNVRIGSAFTDPEKV